MSSTPRRSQQFLENIDKVGRYRGSCSLPLRGRCTRTSRVSGLAVRAAVLRDRLLSALAALHKRKMFLEVRSQNFDVTLSHFCQIFGVLKVKNFACQSSHMSRVGSRGAVVSAALSDRKVAGSIPTIGDFHTVGPCKKAVFACLVTDVK